MAGIDYGVITYKNSQLVEPDNYEGEVRQGAFGEFVHDSTGVVFYRTTIKDHENIDEAETVVRLAEVLTYGDKKVLYSSIKGLTLKTREIYHGTYLTKFKDEKGDFYTVIQGYDVGFDNFYSVERGKVVKKHIKNIERRVKG